MKKLQSEGKVETSLDLNNGDVLVGGDGTAWKVQEDHLEQFNLRMRSSDEGRNMTSEQLLEMQRWDGRMVIRRISEFRYVGIVGEGFGWMRSSAN